MNTNIDCACGKTYCPKDTYNVNRHNASIYHQTFLATGITPAERKEVKKQHEQNIEKNIMRKILKKQLPTEMLAKKRLKFIEKTMMKYTQKNKNYTTLLIEIKRNY